MWKTKIYDSLVWLWKICDEFTQNYPKWYKKCVAFLRCLKTTKNWWINFLRIPLDKTNQICTVYRARRFDRDGNRKSFRWLRKFHRQIRVGTHTEIHLRQHQDKWHRLSMDYWRTRFSRFHKIFRQIQACNCKSNKKLGHLVFRKIESAKIYSWN